jgi:hypothetical protein
MRASNGSALPALRRSSRPLRSARLTTTSVLIQRDRRPVANFGSRHTFQVIRVSFEVRTASSIGAKKLGQPTSASVSQNPGLSCVSPWNGQGLAGLASNKTAGWFGELLQAEAFEQKYCQIPARYGAARHPVYGLAEVHGGGEGVLFKGRQGRWHQAAAVVLCSTWPRSVRNAALAASTVAGAASMTCGQIR